MTDPIPSEAELSEDLVANSEQRYAVKKYSEVDNPQGIPGDWPAEAIPIEEGGDIEGYTTMIQTELDQLRVDNQDAYDTWSDAYKSVVDNQFQLKINSEQRTKWGKQVAWEFHNYYSPLVTNPSDVARLMSIIGPILTFMITGFLPVASSMMENADPNSFLDSVYKPTDTDIPAYDEGETVKVHFSIRISEGII